METINFLKEVFVNENEAKEAVSFFDTLTDSQSIDIFAAFDEYSLPYSYAFVSLFYYHLFRLHKDNQWNDTNLKRLASNYVLNKWMIYGKSFYIITHPNNPVSREWFKNKVQPIIQAENGTQTKPLVFTNDKGKSIRFHVPTYHLAELEYMIKEAYREQAQKINSGFTYYKKEIGLLIEDTFRVRPQLSGFVDWLLKYRKTDRFDFKIQETENTADYVKVEFEFDFTPLQKISKETLKSDLINYCKYEREETKKMVGEKQGDNWQPNPQKARMIMNRFDSYLDSEATKQAGKQNPITLDKIIKNAIGEILKDTSIGISEKQLTRYVKSLHNQTAKEYAGHYVRQKFKDKIKGIS